MVILVFMFLLFVGCNCLSTRLQILEVERIEFSSYSPYAPPIYFIFFDVSKSHNVLFVLFSSLRLYFGLNKKSIWWQDTVPKPLVSMEKSHFTFDVYHLG